MGYPRVRFIKNVELTLKDGTAKLCYSSKNYAVTKVTISREDNVADIYFKDGGVAQAVEMDCFEPCDCPTTMVSKPKKPAPTTPVKEATKDGTVAKESSGTSSDKPTTSEPVIKT
jgi:hypothetical protein